MPRRAGRLLVLIVGFLTVLAGLSGLAPQARASTACTYQATVLPSPGSAAVYGLSDYRSIAVGTSGGVPAYWKDGVLKKVPLPAGYTGGRVTAVNHFGLMVGTASAGNTQRAFRYWHDAKAIVFYPKGEIATDINNAGRAVGYDRENGYEYWRGAQVRRTLAVGPGTQLRAVNGINDANQIVGSAQISTTDDDFRASGLSWSSRIDSLPIELQPTEPGNTYRVVKANAIDNYGRIVGVDAYTRYDSAQGVLWPKANQPQISAPAIDSSENITFTAISANNLTIAGYAAGRWIDDPVYAFGPTRAVMWRGSGDLTVLPSLPGNGNAEARAVHQDGRIGGSAVDATGTSKAVVWTCAGR